MFIDQIKNYAFGIVLVVLITILGMTKWQLNSVTKEFTEYKENINDQISKAEIEKARIEAAQKAKYDSAKSDYDTDRDRLADIIRRLRESGTVPRNETLRVAGDSPSTLPRKAEDTAGAIESAALTARARCPSFYSEAMMDALQCSRLIEFVKP